MPFTSILDRQSDAVRIGMSSPSTQSQSEQQTSDSSLSAQSEKAISVAPPVTGISRGKGKQRDTSAFSTQHPMQSAQMQPDFEALAKSEDVPRAFESDGSYNDYQEQQQDGNMDTGVSLPGQKAAALHRSPRQTAKNAHLYSHKSNFIDDSTSESGLEDNSNADLERSARHLPEPVDITYPTKFRKRSGRPRQKSFTTRLDPEHAMQENRFKTAKYDAHLRQQIQQERTQNETVEETSSSSELDSDELDNKGEVKDGDDKKIREDEDESNKDDEDEDDQDGEDVDEDGVDGEDQYSEDGYDGSPVPGPSNQPYSRKRHRETDSNSRTDKRHHRPQQRVHVQYSASGSEHTASETLKAGPFMVGQHRRPDPAELQAIRAHRKIMGRPLPSTAEKTGNPKRIQKAPKAEKKKKKTYTLWSQKEDDCLFFALNNLRNPLDRTRWSTILKYHGKNGLWSNILQNRTNTQLKDRARV